MPFYRAPDGQRYLTDEPPHPDWVLMTDEEVAEADAPRVTVPQAITMRQARLALLGAGLLSHVNNAIDAMPGQAGEAALIEWEYAQEVQRHSPLIGALGPALGMTPEQIDQLFIIGATL
jgi:hypothetical protein